MEQTNKKTIFLNLLVIRMPVTAVLSILHRVSGVVLALVIPWLLYGFDVSLRNDQGFAQITQLLASIPGKVVLLMLLWMLSHHFCAGIRFLLIDMDLGINKRAAKTSAWVVNVAALVLTLGLGGLVL